MKRLVLVFVAMTLLSLGMSTGGKPSKGVVEFRISPSEGDIAWGEELSMTGSDRDWAKSSGWSISGESAPRTVITFPDGVSQPSWICRIERSRLRPQRVKWVVFFATADGDEYRVAGEEKNEPEPDKISTSYDPESDAWDIEYIYGVWYKKDDEGLFRLQPGTLSFRFTIQRIG